MGLSNRYKKRLLIFSVIPVLALIPFFTENFILRLITAILGVIYVGIIIFLRDSRSDVFREKFEYGNEEEASSEPSLGGDDIDSSFEIVSPNKEIKVAAAEELGSFKEPEAKKIIVDPKLKENFTRIANENIPSNLGDNARFEFILEKFLQIIKSSYGAHSVMFLWYKKHENELAPENYLSDTKDVSRKSFTVEDDYVSRVVTKEEPVFVSEFNPVAESETLRYYVKPQGINSFVGVPMFYGKTLAGVIILDSLNRNAFDLDTIYSLGRIVRVISMLISVFEKRFTESLAEKRLNALINIMGTEKKFQDDKELIDTVEAVANQLVDWDAFVFIMYSPEKKTFNTTRVILKESYKYIGENLEIDLQNTFTGKAIMSGLPVKIDDIKSKKFKRFSASEDIGYDGSFMAIPLVYEEQNYGVLCFEKRKKNFYTNNDVGFIRNSTKILAFFLYTFSAQKLLNSLLSHDVETRALNTNAFIERVSADLYKANQLQVPGAMALIRIDDFLNEGSLFDDNPFPKVLAAVTEVIKKEISPMSIFGRLDERLFAVYFFNVSSKDIYLWGEKLRIQIARKPIAVVSKQTTFTVSIGVASANKKTDINEVLQTAELALGKALEKGGNTVKA